jgi:peptide/nickel transport system substrate-binding protein
VSGEAPGIPWCLVLNTERFPTDDLAVRQALNYATDKDTIIETLFFGLYTAAYGPMSSVTLGYDENLASKYPFDVAKAKSTMEAAGWVMNGDFYEKDGKQCSILFLTPPTDTTSPLLQAQWKAAGINVDIKQEDFSVINPAATKGDHNAATMGWIQGDPDTVGIILYTKNIDAGYGWTRFRDQELDDTLVAAASTIDTAKRKELYTKVQQIVMDNALVLPIYNLFTIYGLHSYVKNFQVDTRGWYPWLYDLYLDKK